MEERRATHRIEVFLESGLVLETDDWFAQDEDPNFEIQAVIDNTLSKWKDIGHLTIRHKDIVGFSVESIEREEQ